MFCAALMLAGCDKGINDDNGNGNGNGDGNGNGGDNTNTEIVLSEDTKTEVTVKADEQGDGKAIKFKAAAAWTATVKDVTQSKADTESEVEWLKLSAYSGEAGDVSLALSISKNFTGVTRKAEIIIQCGETTIKITIEQVAENADGSITKLVKNIISTYEANSAQYSPEGTTYKESNNITYLYDNNRNVSKTYYYGDDIEGETTYDYSIKGEIKVNSREIVDGQTYEEKYIVTLNDKGNAVKVRKFNDENNTYYDKNIISYTEDGRVKQIKEYSLIDREENITEIEYKDGYITQITERSKDYNNSYKFDIPKFYPNKYPNNNIVDMISLYSYDGEFDSFENESLNMLSTIGRLGKTSDYFIELGSSSSYYDEETNPLPGDDAKPGKPNDKIDSFNYTTTDFSKYYAVYSCEYDKDKILKSVTIRSKFDVVNISYDVYLTDKLVHTSEDGTEYYKTEIKNYKEEKKDEGEDIITYTFNYE